ncbi:hypothetical protein PHK61_18150 [Actinomycetospora lutea]|uniref:hypothetical protein n=1 Tax=Actinomycetospora lutea TaxID=663604 RepID=UPI00236737A1|nr:hypothetical protein [Actinomycetospora lutea]MDD7940352.1 hypothetical protein [Actinomycetospora lutea]
MDEPDGTATRAAARRRALAAASGRAAGGRGLADRVRPDERRRYVFQVATTSAFAVAWLVVWFLTGSWIFLALAGGFLLLTALAVVALRVLGRPTDRT